MRLDLVHGAAPRVLVVLAELARAALVVRRRQAQHLLGRRLGAEPVRAAGAAPLGELADGVHAPQVLATIGLDDHRALEPRRLVPLPDEEFPAIPLEGDLDEMRRGRARILITH